MDLIIRSSENNSQPIETLKTSREEESTNKYRSKLIPRN